MKTLTLQELKLKYKNFSYDPSKMTLKEYTEKVNEIEIQLLKLKK